MTFLAIAMSLALLCFIKDVQANGEKILSLEGSFIGFLEYRGCFKTPREFIKRRTDSQNNNNHCVQFCVEIGEIFSATSGKDCYCLNVIPEERADFKVCDTHCKDSTTDKADKCDGFDCCGGKGYVSVYSPKPTPEKDNAEKRSSSSLNIQGCFNDDASDILADEITVKRVDSENTLLRCNKFCLDKGLPVASLRTDHCYCTNELPLNRLYEGVDSARECNLFCSGVLGKVGRCERDQCCGGQQEDGRYTYTVFISGTLDVLKQILRRIDRNFFNQPDVLRQRVWEDPEFCPEGWTAHKTFCYQYSNEKRNFNDAKRDCEEKNSHLFIVQTEDDSDFWSGKLRSHRIGEAWIGLTWNEDERRWYWMNGKPFNQIKAAVGYWIRRPNEDNCPAFTPNLFEVSHGIFNPTDRAAIDALQERLGVSPATALLMYYEKYVLTEGKLCNEKAFYFCQSYLKLVVRGQNPTSNGGATTFQVQTMELASPDYFMENPSDQRAYRDDEVIKMTVVDFQERLTKERSPSEKFLAGSDVVYDNRGEGSQDTRYTYIHTVETSSGVTVTRSSGGSIAATVGTEFETNYFGLASNKWSVSVEYGANWENGKETYTSETTTHLYQFEFPVPKDCVATIAIMKKELPTHIDWRATFYISGWINVEVVGRKKTVDAARLLYSNTQRYLYSFGTNDFGNRPTIVPVKTLECEGDEEPVEEEMVRCHSTRTDEMENCKIRLRAGKKLKLTGSYRKLRS